MQIININWGGIVVLMRYRYHDVICFAGQSFTGLTCCLICECVSLEKAASAAWTAEGRMPSPSFSLDAQLRFHDKWLKIDLQVNFGMNLVVGSDIVLDAKYRVLMFFRGQGFIEVPI